MKLAVGYPWDSPFMFSAFVETALNIKNPVGVETRWIRGIGWCSARMHTDIAEKSLAWGADLICFLGSDQVYDEDILLRLMARYHEGYEVISAMVPIRGHVTGQNSKPFQPMAWRKVDNAFQPIKPGDGDVQEIDLIGTGVFMFPTELLHHLKKPWFKVPIDFETYRRTCAEDGLFIVRLKQEAKARIFVDTTIKVKHSHVFDIDESFLQRFPDWPDCRE